MRTGEAGSFHALPLEKPSGIFFFWFGFKVMTVIHIAAARPEKVTRLTPGLYWKKGHLPASARRLPLDISPGRKQNEQARCNS
ncbi:hypothetical protein [Paenibacillus terreus]|uniref:hypothetical protein n=1 Tax=Paenibacillus terreus TaxID=1387834 RepID=UPI0035CCEB1E